MQRQDSYRELFRGIEIPVRLADGSYKIPINFDNGATTPPFKYVDRVLKDSVGMYGAIHRGGQKALYSTEAYDNTKIKVLNFFNLSQDDGYCVIYVKNTTEGINLLADELCNKQGTKVLSTRMEHHANDLPWRRKAMMFYVEVDNQGVLKLDEFEEKLKFAQGTIKYVTVSCASNVTGYVTPINTVAKIAHKYGAKIIADAAQLVAHQRINMKGTGEDDHIDFLVFSAHKMYAPYGSGAIVANIEIIEEQAPYLLGGGAVAAVLDNDVYFKQSPDKEEAGTPNYLGVMALSAAIDVLNKVGMSNVQLHEGELRLKLLKGLESINEVILYGDSEHRNRLGVVTFNVKRKHHSEVTQRLADHGGIAVRNGCFCAHPYVARLLQISDEERYELMLDPEAPAIGMIRASLGLYNTSKEIDEFLEMVEWICK